MECDPLLNYLDGWPPGRLPFSRAAQSMTLTKIISGGQTGVDRAALDAAQLFNLRQFAEPDNFRLAIGGWCPKGRLAEDGPILASLPLEETPSAEYPQRTEWNIRDSDATLILTRGLPTGGTARTVESCRKRRKPHLVVDLNSGALSAMEHHVVAWLEGSKEIRVLNVAGPRESKCPGIYEQARTFLLAVFTALFPASDGE